MNLKGSILFEGQKMNHKRGKPKNARSGCFLCKPHKMNGSKKRGMTNKEYEAWKRSVVSASFAVKYRAKLKKNYQCLSVFICG